MLRLSLVAALLGIASSAWADPFLPLTGEALRQELVGSLLEIDTPLAGVVVPVEETFGGWNFVSGEAGAACFHTRYRSRPRALVDQP